MPAKTAGRDAGEDSRQGCRRYTPGRAPGPSTSSILSILSIPSILSILSTTAGGEKLVQTNQQIEAPIAWIKHAYRLAKQV
jgi:hypothetical protein